jgi:hypothetical protein
MILSSRDTRRLAQDLTKGRAGSDWMENEVGENSNQTHYYKVFGRGNSWEVSMT